MCEAPRLSRNLSISTVVLANNLGALVGLVLTFLIDFRQLGLQRIVVLLDCLKIAVGFVQKFFVLCGGADDGFLGL
jgi:hypothetical protein